MDSNLLILSEKSPECAADSVRPAAGKKVVPLFSVHLDAVRGIAALVVFLTHARQLFFAAPSGHFFKFTEVRPANAAAETTTLGHQAVIVFFVLSGLLVGGSVLRDVKSHRWSWPQYLLNRLTRLWIVLLPALVLGLCLDSYGVSHFVGHHSIYDAPPGQTQIASDIRPRMVPSVMAGNALFLQGVSVTVFGSNSALWSLSYEFWYYILFPFLALSIWGSKKAWYRWLCGLCFALLFLFLPYDIELYFASWLLGAALALIPASIPRALHQTAFVCGAIQFLALNVWVRKALLPIAVSDGILAIDCFVFLYCVLHLKGSAGSGLYKKAAQFLSRMSYTLYLTHLPALVLLCAITLQPWRRLTADTTHTVQFVAVLVCVFAYSVAVFYFFESHTDRVRNWLKKRLAFS